MSSVDPSDTEVAWNHAVYMLGKLTDVVNALVVGGGDVRSRLREATPSLLALLPDMFPETEGIRARIERALSTLTKYHDPLEYAERPRNWPGSKFDHTLSRIRNSTGSKIASDLFGAWMDLDALVSQHFFQQSCSADADNNTGEVFFVEHTGEIPPRVGRVNIIIIDNIPSGDS